MHMSMWFDLEFDFDTGFFLDDEVILTLLERILKRIVKHSSYGLSSSINM